MSDPEGSDALKRPRHQLLHDLRGAGVDAVHAGIRIGARDRVLQHVAVAAEQLQAGVEHLVVVSDLEVAEGSDIRKLFHVKQLSVQH